MSPRDLAKWVELGGSLGLPTISEDIVIRLGLSGSSGFWSSSQKYITYGLAGFCTHLYTLENDSISSVVSVLENSDIALFLWRLTFRLAVMEASKPIIAVIDTAITPTANITSTSVKAFFCFKFGFIFYLLITSSISS